MNLAQQGSRILLQTVYTCALGMILSSCAELMPPGRTASAAPSRRPPISKPAPEPIKPAAKPAVVERKPILQPIAPSRAPTRAEQITRLVSEGHLMDEANGMLVFSKAGKPKDAGSGLFEDAILLGRLRRALKEAVGIPESVSDTATVRGAKAVLNIDDTLPAPTAARAIDAALRTPGVNAVQARIAG
jgi:hypothetical protein